MVFVPGKSGNPVGRPRKSTDVVQLAKEMSPEAMATLRRHMRQTTDNKLSLQAALAILAYALGKPKAAVETTSKVEQVTIEVSDTEAARKIAFALAKGVKDEDKIIQ